MSQAQKNQEPLARVRSTPPPLPRPSHIAPVATRARSTPPPPPLAAILPPRPKPSLAPRLSVPAPAHLAIVPLWDDANLPLRPAAPQQLNEKMFWIGTTTVSLAVGALVAASLMTLRFGDYAQILPHGHAEPVVHATSAQAQLLAAAVIPADVLTDVPAPVQTFEADEPLEIDLSEIEETSVAPQTIEIPELKVTSGKAVKSAKVAKSAKAAKYSKAKPSYRAPKQRGKRGKRGRTMPAAITAEQPDPQVEARVQADTEAQPTEAPAQPEAAATVAPETAEPAPQPEAAAPEAEIVPPPAPALPDNLTRAQVKAGLDKVRAKVLACTHGSYGKILADVTISAPGQVSSTVIDGTFAGTKAAECMVQKISNAKFPAFAGADISVRYPYSF